jgi:hypothetical protein
VQRSFDEADDEYSDSKVKIVYTSCTHAYSQQIYSPGATSYWINGGTFTKLSFLALLPIAIKLTLDKMRTEQRGSKTAGEIFVTKMEYMKKEAINSKM